MILQFLSTWPCSSKNMLHFHISHVSCFTFLTAQLVGCGKRVILLQIKVSSSVVGLRSWTATPFGNAKQVTFLWQVDDSLFSNNKHQPVYEKVLLGFQLSFESVVDALLELHTQKIFANIFLEHLVQRFFLKIAIS